MNCLFHLYLLNLLYLFISSSHIFCIFVIQLRLCQLNILGLNEYYIVQGCIIVLVLLYRVEVEFGAGLDLTKKS